MFNSKRLQKLEDAVDVLMIRTTPTNRSYPQIIDQKLAARVVDLERQNELFRGLFKSLNINIHLPEQKK